MNYADLKYEFRLGNWRYDPWGTTMGWLFAISDRLHFDHGMVPDHWQFSPGIGPDIDAYEYQALEGVSAETMVRFGNMLERYSNKLRQAEKDY